MDPRCGDVYIYLKFSFELKKKLELFEVSAGSLEALIISVLTDFWEHRA